jgi:hypothetical protein
LSNVNGEIVNDSGMEKLLLQQRMALESLPCIVLLDLAEQSVLQSHIGGLIKTNSSTTMPSQTNEKSRRVN